MHDQYDIILSNTPREERIERDLEHRQAGRGHASLALAALMGCGKPLE